MTDAMQHHTAQDTLGFPRYVVVEGVIGVGKTTLVNRLAQRLNAHTVLEIFEENPFLAKFYEDKERHAFATEMFFLLSRYQQQETFAQVDLFERHSISDYLFPKSRLFASLTLSEHELALYDRVYSILTAQVLKPDLVIHLRAPLPVLLDRVRSRGREYELNMDPAYMERLRGLYHNFFAHYDETPLLEIDTEDVNFAEDDAAVDALIQQLRALG